MNAQAEQVSVDNVELGQISNAVVEMNRVETGLALMRKNYANLIVDPTTPTGMEMAKAARAAIREPRYLVERIRKAAKAPLLALGKKLDSEAARITSELMKLETPIHDAIVEVENQQERERLAKLAAEEKRKSDLQARVIELRGNPSLSANDSPDLVAQHIADLEAIPIGEDFAEFTQQATDAKAGGLARLRAIHAAAVERLAEQERIKAERAELARLREEAAERDRQTAARLAEEERIRREAQAKADAEAKAERDRLAAEAEEIRQKQVAEARAHAQKLAEERAEADRLAAVRQAELDAEAERIAEERRAVERDRESLIAAQKPKETIADDASVPAPILEKDGAFPGDEPGEEELFEVWFQIHRTKRWREIRPDMGPMPSEGYMMGLKPDYRTGWMARAMIDVTPIRDL